MNAHAVQDYTRIGIMDRRVVSGNHFPFLSCSLYFITFVFLGKQPQVAGADVVTGVVKLLVPSRVFVCPNALCFYSRSSGGEDITNVCPTNLAVSDTYAMIYGVNRI